MEPHHDFPPAGRALREPNGLLAAGGALTPDWLVKAYRRGIFPWYSEGQPVLWWSPDPRMVLIPDDFRISRSLGKRIRRHDYEIRVDTCFDGVMRSCAQPREGQSGTWIDEAIIAAYTGLHRAGHAHSVETWIDGVLAGGLYGVALGRMFFGESMFTRAPDASKLALAHLVRQLQRWSFGLIDCQMSTAHLASLGAREMPRADFLRKLAGLIDEPAIAGPWHFDYDLFE